MKDNSIRDKRFFCYLKSLGIKQDNDVLILPAISHYYYDSSEIKNTHTIVHTKELNKLSNIESFIRNTIDVLSKDSTLIGCFTDNSIQTSRILYCLTNVLEGSGRKYLSRKKIINIFQKVGVLVVDISEIKGLTYFCIKKV